VVAGTWGAAAGCFCRERLEKEKNTLLAYYSHFRNITKEIFPKIAKMTKIPLKVQKLTEKLPPN
jgi:hypothetical protein